MIRIDRLAGLAALLATAVVLVACAHAQQASVTAADVPVVKIYRHSAWEETPPKGVAADGIRRNLAPGDSVEFKDLTVAVEAMLPAATDENGAAVASEEDRVTVALTRGGEHDIRTVNEGDAFNWNGYHVAILAIYTARGELGNGSTVFEIATIESLPAEVANSTRAGGPENRLRVPHTIDKLTLHHSATSHQPGDDLGQKLRNMVSWGERDRKWWDIPYHYIIDLDGMVFQARDHRYVGDTNTRYNPAGHFLINCFGNYSQVEPNEKQLETIANLMAWAAMEYKIDPLVIYGHRDLAQTSCPGDNLYRYITDGSLKRMVEASMAKGQPRLEWLDEIEKP